MSEELTLEIRLKADGSGLVGEVKASDKALEQLGEEGARAGRRLKRFGRDSEQAARHARRLRTEGQALARGLRQIQMAAATVGGGLLARSFVAAASEAEQFRVRLKVLLGSVSEGNRLFEDMARFASRVPFEYREVMASATQLAGVMRGGVDEIVEWMPLIADLAAAAGLGIRETTEQVTRMLSSGAASADMFRERGILAMLGFQAGVTVSAEETRRRLMESWKKTTSRFRGATDELARTWVGAMSMLSDKWFQFRNEVMNAGLFDYLKALVGAWDSELGTALDHSKDRASTWSEGIVDGIDQVLRASSVLADVWFGFQLAFKAAQIGFEGLKLAVLEGVDALQGPLRFLGRLTGRDLTLDGGAIRLWASETRDEIDRLKGELATLADIRNAPSRQWRARLDEVRANYEALRREARATAATLDRTSQAQGAAGDSAKKLSKGQRSLLDTLFPTAAAARRYRESISELSAMLKAGHIDQDTYRRGLVRLRMEFEETEKLPERQAAAVSKLAATHAESFRELRQAVDGWSRDFASRMVDGERSFRGFVDTVLRELQRIALAKATEPLFDFFGTALEGVVSSFIPNLIFGGGGFTSAVPGGLGSVKGPPVIAHRGGVIGADALPTRPVAADLFLGARRYHAGGIAGDEVPAILRRGEEVLTRSDPRHRDNMGAAGVTVVYNIDARGADAGVEERIREAMRESEARTLARIQETRRRGGSAARALGVR